MENLKLINIQAQTLKEIPLNTSLLIDKINNQAMFDSVLAYNAGKRQGTHSTLTKGEVRGGGKKPYAQKHTGNARQGSIRNPHFVGGGVTFGPKPNRNYKLYLNSKVSKLAFKSAFSLKANPNNMFVLDDNISLSKPSTKSIVSLLKNMNLINKKVLFILNENQESLYLSIKNVKNTMCKQWNQVSVKDILNAKYIIIQNQSIENLAGRLN